MGGDADDEPEDAVGVIDYSIEGGVTVLHMRGRYNLVQFRKALANAVQDPDFARPMTLVMDAREAKINPSVAELGNAVDIFAAVREHYGDHAHLVVSSTLHYGLSHISAVFAEMNGIHLHVHRDIEAARRAVGLIQREPEA